MPRGKPARKLAISMDPDVHAGVAAAAAEGVSLSAWLTAAAQRALLIRDGLDAVAEWESDHEPFSDAEIDAARGRVADELRSGRARSA